MDLFDALALLGGLSLFLFGMGVMGQALERRAGDRLRSVLARLTSGRAAGLLTGLAVTAVIQSSSAATVMVVGFVNSGLMTLRQAVNVIMGANIGTTVTAWLLSLTGAACGCVCSSLPHSPRRWPLPASSSICSASPGRKRTPGLCCWASPR